MDSFFDVYSSNDEYLTIDHVNFAQITNNNPNKFQSESVDLTKVKHLTIITDNIPKFSKSFSKLKHIVSLQIINNTHLPQAHKLAPLFPLIEAIKVLTSGNSANLRGFKNLKKIELLFHTRSITHYDRSKNGKIYRTYYNDTFLPQSFSATQVILPSNPTSKELLVALRIEQCLFTKSGLNLAPFKNLTRLWIKTEEDIPKHLQHLPDGIPTLSKLKDLSLWSFIYQTDLPYLHNLEKLTLNSFKSIHRLNLSNISKQLTTIDLCSMPNLEYVNIKHQLHLQVLTIAACPILTDCEGLKEYMEKARRRTVSIYVNNCDKLPRSIVPAGTFNNHYNNVDDFAPKAAKL